MTAKVGLLSGGQRQALTLLMAALQQPKLLLLDEHTAALDPRTAAKVLDLSDRIVQEHGLTTLMITHNMKDAIAPWQPPHHDGRRSGRRGRVRRRKEKADRPGSSRHVLPRQRQRRSQRQNAAVLNITP